MVIYTRIYLKGGTKTKGGMIVACRLGARKHGMEERSALQKLTCR